MFLNLKMFLSIQDTRILIIFQPCQRQLNSNLDNSTPYKYNSASYPVNPFRGGGGIYPLKRYSYKKNMEFQKLLLIGRNFLNWNLEDKKFGQIFKNKINHLFLTIFQWNKILPNFKKFCHTKFFFPFLQKCQFSIFKL